MLVSWYSHPPKSHFIQAVPQKYEQWSHIVTKVTYWVANQRNRVWCVKGDNVSQWVVKREVSWTRDSSGPQESLCLRRHFVPCWRNNQRRHYVSRSTTQNSTLARDTRFHTSFSHQLTNIPLASGAFIQDLLKFMRMRETSRELFAPTVILCGA